MRRTGAQLDLRLSKAETGFQPGARVEGTAFWSLPAAPRSVEVRLFWYTKGVAPKDLMVVETVAFVSPPPTAERVFALTLPAGPYSFTGKLVSLVWALELVVAPGDEATAKEIVVAPGARPIRLDNG